ncbi:MAG: rod shape-determining protein MreC [Bacteroidetes bacterium]|nr:rod shape-determining protein MreC [Bacteroidota bacterium]
MLYLFRLLRNNLFAVTFILLLGISVSQVVRYNIYQESFYFNSSRAILNNIAASQFAVKEYFDLREVNKALLEENNRLRSSGLRDLVFSDTGVIVNRDSNGKKRYTYVTCRVVKNSTRMRNNFITIDKGWSSGIKRGMAVISPSGIAGLVYEVNENFSLVLSVLNSKFVTTPMIPAIQFREGSITWNGRDPSLAQLNWVNKFEKLSPGMDVLTSNFSVKYPPGIPIGKIKSVRKKPTSSFYDVDIVLATNFNKIGFLYVVKDNFTHQLDTLSKNEEVIYAP